jgi:hypothetical protein
MPYFAIPNFVTREIKQTYDDPLEAAQDARVNRPHFPTKDDRREWLNKPKTDSRVISLFEGLNPDLRVSIKEGNPPTILHGVIVDYDAKAPGSLQDIVKHIREFYKDTPALTPQWLVQSPSGNYRLVWEFADGCSLRGLPDKFILSFLAEFKKLCKLGSVMAGLDDAAYLKPSTYYDADGIWEVVNADFFPISDLDGVFFSSVRKATKEDLGGGELMEIPMEAIKDRIDELFPGRWPVDIPFVDGCRGPAVWDPIATNPTTTMYSKRGAFRFSSDKGFHTYAEILGKDFVRQWEDNKLGQATKGFFYCPNGTKNYFVRSGGRTGTWEPQGLGDVQRRLVNNWRLSRKAPSASEVSEVDQAVQFIQDCKKIDGCIPFIYDKRDVVDTITNRFLNIARAKVLEPIPEATDQKQPRYKVTPGRRHPYRWGEGFPWIARWLDSWFPLGAPRKQLVYLLCWIKQGYEGARRGEPQKGQALFLVGGTDRGKTLFNGEFMERIFGGSRDAGKFLLGKTDFNKELLEAGHWRVDDAEAAVDKRDHTRFTERVKQFVANPTVPYHPKFVDALSVPYNGRLCITLNEDEESLRMIPDLDRNIADKVLILRLADDKGGLFQFPSRGDVSKNLTTQLPYFLRWLINWMPPEYVTKGFNRFGMRAYIHERVRLSSLSAGLDSDLLDIMAPLWANDDDFKAMLCGEGAWTGSAADLFSLLASNPVTSMHVRGMTTRVLGKKLSTLSGIPGSGVEKVEGRSRMRCYKVRPPELLLANEESPMFVKPEPVA